MSDDLTPDLGDVLQEEQPHVPMTAIPVTVEGPVRVQDAPARTLVVVQQFLDSTGGIIQPVRILGEDPRRQIARIVAKDQDIRVGTSQKQVMNPDTCAIWPKLVPLEITAASEVWLAADTATTRVSAVLEQWAL